MRSPQFDREAAKRTLDELEGQDLRFIMNLLYLMKGGSLVIEGRTLTLDENRTLCQVTPTSSGTERILSLERIDGTGLLAQKDDLGVVAHKPKSHPKLRMG